MANENETLTLTFDREEIEVDIKTKESPISLECTIREMTGKERDEYLNSIRTNRSVTSSASNPAVKNFKDIQAILIAMCLFKRGTDERIDIKEIREFPSKTQTELFKLCDKVNGLMASQAEDEAKND